METFVRITCCSTFYLASLLGFQHILKGKYGTREQEKGIHSNDLKLFPNPRYKIPLTEVSLWLLFFSATQLVQYLPAILSGCAKGYIKVVFPLMKKKEEQSLWPPGFGSWDIHRQKPCKRGALIMRELLAKIEQKDCLVINRTDIWQKMFMKYL